MKHGIYNDETNEHVDNICAFIHPGEVVLAWTDNPDDAQYAYSKSCFEALCAATDAKGRKLIVHKLPIPDFPVCITQEELDGYAFETGENEREVGERLAASYVNFYFSNGAVIFPQFGGENIKSDERAVRIMARLCPEREVIPIFARDIIIGGGNIHCITQQIPKGVKRTMKKVTVAAIQMKCEAQSQTNLDTAQRLVREAAGKGANIILLPELFERRYFCQQKRYDFYNYATPANANPAVLRFMTVAKELSAVIVVSFFEKDGNAGYNSVAVIDADGGVLGVYRKTHIPDDHYYQEKFYFAPGNTGLQSLGYKVRENRCRHLLGPVVSGSRAVHGA